MHHSKPSDHGRVRRTLAAAFAVMLVVPAVGAAPTTVMAAAPVVPFHLLIDFSAEHFVSTCPVTPWEPLSFTVCDDWYMNLAQEGVPPGQRAAPLRMYVFHHVWTAFPAGTGEVSFAQGFGEVADGDADTIHLTTAWEHASIPMDDGTSADINLAWDMSSALFHSSGPLGPDALNNFPEWHTVGACFVQNIIHTQHWRAGGVVTGTIGGVDISAWHYTGVLLTPFGEMSEPILSSGSFEYIYVPQGGCS